MEKFQSDMRVSRLPGRTLSFRVFSPFIPAEMGRGIKKSPIETKQRFNLSRFEKRKETAGRGGRNARSYIHLRSRIRAHRSERTRRAAGGIPLAFLRRRNSLFPFTARRSIFICLFLNILVFRYTHLGEGTTIRGIYLRGTGVRRI